MAGKSASLSINIIADAAKAKAGFKEAETAFGKFRNSVNEANGSMGKFKVGAGAAMDYVKNNAMNFATAAGAAIVAFGVQSVNSFKNLALEVGKFSDTTGFAIEDASRLIEVAGDIGIEAGTVEKSLGFMNKTLGNTPELFKQLGIEIEYTSGGAKDMNGTFLNVVERIKSIRDPAERAALASKLLGKGWAEMSELIMMGSGKLVQSMKEVSDQKVITEEERKRADELRMALDDLKGSFEDISNAVGKTLTPILSSAIEKFMMLKNAMSAILDIPVLGDALMLIVNPLERMKTGIGFMDNLIDKIRGVKDETGSTYVVTDELARAWRDGYSAMVDAQPAADNLNAELERQQTLLDEAKSAWDRFRGALNFKAEVLQLQTDIETFRIKWAGTTDEAKRKSREYQQELLNIQIKLANMGGQIVGLATTAQQNTIRFYTNTGQLERALSLINAIKAGLNNLAGRVTPDRVERLLAAKPMASGGIVISPQFSLVGEAGPEAVIPLTRPARALQLMQDSGLDMLAMSAAGRGGGGQTVVVNVQAGLVSSPDQVGAQIIDAIRRAERRSGQVFAAV